MAKYTIEESTLTSIADAIRTQYDDDSPINPLDMADAILGIEGGGSGGDIPIEWGEFTPTSNIESYTIEHGRDKSPIGILVVSPYTTANYAMRIYASAYTENRGGVNLYRTAISYNGYSSGSSAVLVNTNSVDPLIEDGKITVYARNQSTTYVYLSGVTYYYVLLFAE